MLCISSHASPLEAPPPLTETKLQLQLHREIYYIYIIYVGRCEGSQSDKTPCFHMDSIQEPFSPDSTALPTELQH